MEKNNQNQTTGLKKENQTADLKSVKFEEDVKICPLCGKPYKGWGNNPYPLDIDPVCSDCDWNVILPLRLGVNEHTPKHIREKILYQLRYAREMARVVAQNYIETGKVS